MNPCTCTCTVYGLPYHAQWEVVFWSKGSFCRQRPASDEQNTVLVTSPGPPQSPCSLSGDTCLALWKYHNGREHIRGSSLGSG